MRYGLLQLSLSASRSYQSRFEMEWGPWGYHAGVLAFAAP